MKNPIYYIVAIVTFVAAIFGVVIAIVFALRFDQDKLNKYTAVVCVNENNPEMLKAADTTTVQGLTNFISNYTTEGDSLSKILKAKQLQKNIVYTYITELNELKEETFTEYKNNFTNHSAALFAQADDPQTYIDGFNGVNEFKDLNAYISKLTEQYNVIKQDYIKEKTIYTAQNTLLKDANDVNQVVNEQKKQTDLTTLKSDWKSFVANSKILNVMMCVIYVLFFFALISALYFAVKTIIVNASFKTLIFIGIFGIIIFLCFMFTPTWIDALMVVFYIGFFGTICAVLYDVVSRLIGRLIK